MAAAYLCKPLSLGADVVIHSSSKYINGSSDSISGIIVSGGKFVWDKEKYPVLSEYQKYGPLAYLLRLRSSLWASMGSCLSPFNAYLNIIGLETLGLRMKQICQNAACLSKALSELEGISVNSLSLPQNENAELVKEQFKGLGGGVFTLRAGSKERALKIIDSLKYAQIVSNIGDVRTLVLYPASTLYIHDTEEEMHAAGVFEDTIRVSVGIEDAGDLIEDFLEAIKKSE
jgi:O-acetylhomoserine (thiol)-lyase